MTDVQERWRHWDERKGLVEIGHASVRDGRLALVRSLATMHQALETFDRIVELLGDRAFIDPAGGDAFQILHVREGEWLVAQPLIVVAFVPTSVTGPIIQVSDPVRPSDGERTPDKIVPDIVPRSRMRAGSIRLAEGHRHFESTYDDAGKHKENVVSAADPWIPLRHPNRRHVIDPLARPPTLRPISILLRDDLDPNGVRPDALARMILEVERSPGRVRVPALLPGGVQGAWARGLTALRRRVFANSGDRFVIVDGLDGTSFGAGPTLEAARRAWDADLFRAKPKPPKPSAPTNAQPPPKEPRRVERDAEGKVTSISTGTIEVSFGGGGPSIDWPAAIPANMPAAMIELPDLPADIPSALHAAGFDRWVRLIGSLGDPCAALVREDRDGLTFIGEGIADIVEIDHLDEALDRCDTKEREMVAGPPPWEDPRFVARVASYVCWDLGWQRPMPFALTGSSWMSVPFSPEALDGNQARFAVTRVRKLR